MLMKNKNLEFDALGVLSNQTTFFCIHLIILTSSFDFVLSMGLFTIQVRSLFRMREKYRTTSKYVLFIKRKKKHRVNQCDLPFTMNNFFFLFRPSIGKQHLLVRLANEGRKDDHSRRFLINDKKVRRMTSGHLFERCSRQRAIINLT